MRNSWAVLRHPLTSGIAAEGAHGGPHRVSRSPRATRSLSWILIFFLFRPTVRDALSPCISAPSGDIYIFQLFEKVKRDSRSRPASSFHEGRPAVTQAPSTPDPSYHRSCRRSPSLRATASQAAPFVTALFTTSNNPSATTKKSLEQLR